MSILKVISMCVILSMTICTSAYADSDTGKTAFSLGLCSVTSNASNPSIGDTVSLNLTFTPVVSATAKLRLFFPGSVAPPDQGTSEVYRDSIFWVDSGVTYNFAIPLKVFGRGASMLQATLQTQTPVPGYASQISFSALDIEHTSSLFRVLGPGNVLHDSLSFQAESLGFTPAQCSISGNVVYYDHHIGADRGVYGAYAILVFRKVGAAPGPPPLPCSFDMGAGFTLHHPVSGWTEGIHYSKIGVDGSFSFNFIANLGDWSHYSDVQIYVTNWNDAVYLMNDPADADSSGGVSLLVWSGGGFPGNMSNPPEALTTYRRAHSWCAATTSSNTITHTGIKLRLDTYDGAIMRKMQMSREFSLERFNFDPERVQTLLYKDYPKSGELDGSQLKMNKPGGRSAHTAVCAHEWGHWFEMRRQMSVVGREAFAEFHAFAVMNWIPGFFGETAYFWAPDNPESWWWEFDPDTQKRWKGTYYNSYNVAGVASFLWNLYDGYESSPWEYTAIGEGDNDDVEVREILIEEIVNPAYFLEDLVDAVKERVSPNWPTESDKAQSIQAIFDCMDAPDAVPLIFPPMLPPQIKNLQGDKIGSTYELTWELQSYSGTPAGWHNVHEIKVYQMHSVYGWTVVEELNGDETEVEILGGDDDFIVTAFNASGESSDAMMLTNVQKPATGTRIGKNQFLVDMRVNQNPVTSDPVALRLSGEFPEAHGLVSIMSSTGQVVREVYSGDVSKASEISLNLSDLSSGTYFVTLDAFGSKYYVRLTKI